MHLPLSASVRLGQGRRTKTLIQTRTPVIVRSLIALCFIGLALNVVFYQSLSKQANVPSLASFLHDGNHTLATMRRRTLEVDETVIWDRLRRNLEKKALCCKGNTTVSLLRRRKQPAANLLDRLRTSVSLPSTHRCKSLPASGSNDNEYAIIATTAFSNPRTVFVNCLKWLLDTNVKEIWLLVQSAQQHDLDQDEDYGSRILHWNETLSHPVKVIVADTLWQALAEVDAHSNIVTAITWRHADVPWSGTHTAMQAAVRDWQLRPTVLWATHGWLVDASWQCRGSNSHMGEPLAISKVSNLSTAASDSSVILLTLNGMMFHRDYLCLVNHPLLKELRGLTTSSWELAEQALQLLLMDVHLNFAFYDERLLSEGTVNFSVENDRQTFFGQGVDASLLPYMGG